MQQLGELQSQIADIRALDAEVIALSSRGNERDVRRTHDQLKLSYSLVPTPVSQVIKDFGLSTDQYGTSYGTVIIDKTGVVRFVHDSINENNRTSVSEIRRVLQDIRP
jgi:peroxiredoxin